MRKMTLSKSKKIPLIIPETCYQPSFLFSIPNVKLYSYRINPTFRCDPITQKKTILYTPSLFVLWALHYAVENPHLFSSLLCYGKQWDSSFALIYLKLRLQNERHLLGSDVPSPTVMKTLLKHVEISNYSALPIGKWLKLVKNYKTNYKKLSIPLFWLDDYKNNTDFHQIISKL
ncbi:hypothetical protein [Bartonella sp. B41]